MTEPDPSLEEELEAAALRAALDEGRSHEHLPSDALEAASLLRFSGNAGQLSEERSARLRHELLSSLPERRASAGRPRMLIWLAALGGVGALVALLFTFKPAPTATYADNTSAAPRFEPLPMSAPAVVRPGPIEPRQAEPLAVARNTAPEAEAPAASLRMKRPSVEGLGRAAPKAAESDSRLGSSGALARAPTDRARAAAPAAGAAPPSASVAAKPSAGPSGTGQQLRAARVDARRELLARVDDPSLSRDLRQADSRSDAARSPEERQRARQALLTALGDTQAAGFDDAEKRPLQQDLYWRLAELSLRQGQPEQALEWARQGIALDGPPSPFLGLLWQAQGEAHEALGDKAAAASSYFNAQSITEDLLRKNVDN
jgi:hypothetical protein